MGDSEELGPDPTAAEVEPSVVTSTPTAMAADAAVRVELTAELQQDMDIVARLVGHRLQQEDIRQILDRLTQNDQAVFTDKIAEVLRKTSALLEVSRRVSDSLSLDVLLPRMVEIISDFLQAERCTLFLHDPESGTLYSRVAQGEGVGEIRFPAHLGIAGAVFSSGSTEIIPDAYADPRFNQEVDKKTGYRTRNILCAPIRAKDRVIGVAQVLNKNKGDFLHDDLQLLDAITSQAASAFLNAQLHEQIARAAEEEAQLLEVTTAISRELHLLPLLQKIMETVTAILAADRSTLFLYDSKTKELWSRVAQGVGVAEIRFPAHLGIAGSVFQSGATINIPDAYADSRFNKEIDKKTGYKTDSILCMAVVNKAGETIGAMQVLNKKGGPFTSIDEKRLKAFTSQAAIALENARLFEDVINMRNYNESILQSMTNGVITLDAEGGIAKANLAALRLFRCESQPEAMIGLDAADFFAVDNAWVLESKKRVEESGKQDVTLDQELMLREPGGSQVTDERRRETASVNLSVVPLTDANDARLGCMLLIEDLTREKRLRGTMARYMTKEVADKLLEEGEGVLGGQIQKASVLFSDIRSFTSISERIGAQRTVSMLNDYFTIMVDIILENGGILDKYIGDAMMAVFGAPFSGERDADNAVCAAIGMLRALHAFNARRQSEGEDPVLMGLGINTDEVLSGNIGSPKRMDYTVIGDGVNLASRLEGANKPYGTQILISELTVRELRGNYLLREVDKLRVKGKTAPVAVFEVLDHYTQEGFPNLEEVVYLYSCGLDHYKQRDWQKAQEIFDEALLINNRDALSRMYRDRCAHFLREPPPDDWDGVWTMKTK